VLMGKRLDQCGQERDDFKLREIESKVVFERNGTKFTIKESVPCGGVIKKKQDKHFPSIDKLDYNNWLVAVNQIFSFGIQY